MADNSYFTNGTIDVLLTVTLLPGDPASQYHVGDLASNPAYGYGLAKFQANYETDGTVATSHSVPITGLTMTCYDPTVPSFVISLPYGIQDGGATGEPSMNYVGVGQFAFNDLLGSLTFREMSQQQFTVLSPTVPVTPILP